MTHDAPALPTKGTASVTGAVELARARGLLTDDEVHRLGITAWDASRSHPVVVVRRGDGSGVVVKFPVEELDERQGSLERERAAYELAAGRPALRDLLPGLVASEANGVLVTERVAGIPLHELLHQRRRSEPTLVAAAAEVIGRWHRLAPPIDLRRLRPWVLDACSDPPGFLRKNEGTRRLLAERSSGWDEGLAGAAAAWTDECAVHGDLRVDNVLVMDGGERLVLVDWECAGRGDPAWDVGALVSEVLARAGVRRVTARLAPGVRATLDATITAYEGAAARSLTPAWRRRVNVLCGARLAMRALQTASQRPQPEPDAYRLAELAAQLLGDQVVV